MATTTPAMHGILLRRIEYGDDDLILTFFTQDHGKISAVGKYAKRSKKRFQGVLELFSALEIVLYNGRGKLPILQEASLSHPFDHIRQDIRKTAYASYWAELIHEGIEEKQNLPQIYHLFHYVLNQLNTKSIPEAVLSILFQLRLMDILGLNPNLTHCSDCGMELEKIDQTYLNIDVPKGGLLCKSCSNGSINPYTLSKGTLKHLLWLTHSSLEHASRLRFSPQSIHESLTFIESFVPYHLGIQLKSLKVLSQVR